MTLSKVGRVRGNVRVKAGSSEAISVRGKGMDETSLVQGPWNVNDRGGR